MEGLNKRFKDDTEEFLRTTAIFEAPRHVNNAPPQGIVEFDLQPYHGIAARFGDFAHRPKAATWKSNRIKAYWLPWNDGGVADIQLGSEADYFFTSQLAGCQIRIVPSPPSFGRTNHPRILHIAGNVQDIHDVTGTIWRNQQAQATLGPVPFGRSRALSSTALLGPGGYRDEGVNVVGFVKWFRWRFWGQQIDFDNFTVARVWEIT